MADQAGFLGRWSRRKLEQVSESSKEPGELPVAEPQAQAPAEQGAANKPLSDADLPALDSLGEDADFSGFLSEGVSEALRKRALRQLFHGSQFNIRDGLNEYDDDFSTFVPLGDTVTRQMKQWAEDTAQRLLSDEPAEQPSDGLDPSGEVVEAAFEVEPGRGDSNKTPTAVDTPVTASQP